ncbi:FHA domain-containing protein [Streptobacillus ratti]|uniref:FHA domain-containing protein n=1 Tax=Streptobacillus ratti TaxID=1720557 RepID=UPI000932D6F7|nr:FHA domain-containing protein [Streptobacillus ratti]
MKLLKCSNGHMYNTTKYSNCPYCDGNKINIEKEEEKRPIILEGDTKTSVFWIKETNVSPVVGWLVCISGSEKGKDYRLINERNFIGRSSEMNVCIESDKTIARKNHCSITYNPKQRVFVISPGESSGLVYLQGKALYESKQILNLDIIEMGENKFIFIEFCGMNFDWNY